MAGLMFAERVAVQHTRHPGEERRDDKDHELVVRHVHAVGLRGDAVIADGHDGASVAGILEVHHHDDDEEHQHDAVRQERLGVGVDRTRVQTLRAAGDVQVRVMLLMISPQPSDNDGEVVALQAQGGQADDQAHKRGGQTAR